MIEPGRTWWWMLAAMSQAGGGGGSAQSVAVTFHPSDARPTSRATSTMRGVIAVRRPEIDRLHATAGRRDQLVVLDEVGADVRHRPGANARVVFDRVVAQRVTSVGDRSYQLGMFADPEADHAKDRVYVVFGQHLQDFRRPERARTVVEGQLDAGAAGVLVDERGRFQMRRDSSLVRPRRHLGGLGRHAGNRQPDRVLLHRGTRCQPAQNQHHRQKDGPRLRLNNTNSPQLLPGTSHTSLCK